MGMCWPSRNWLEPISASGKTALRRVATGMLDEALLIRLAILCGCASVLSHFLPKFILTNSSPCRGKSTSLRHADPRSRHGIAVSDGRADAAWFVRLRRHH